MAGHSDRYLVLIDILGFSDLVASRPSSEIYTTLDRSLEVFRRWEKLNGEFSTIHFSDTFLFYQKEPGYLDKAFLDAYAIGRMLFCALLAEGIPARGAVSFGEFIVQPDESGRHLIYFGPALIEAHRAEVDKKWVGMTVLQSAWQPYETANAGVIDAFAKERMWKRATNGTLLLNPFQRMCSYYQDDQIGEISKPYLEWDAPEFPNEIRAFKFLHDELARREPQGAAGDRIVTKYKTTVSFVRDVLGEDVYEWGTALAREVDAGIG